MYYHGTHICHFTVQLYDTYFAIYHKNHWSTSVHIVCHEFVWYWVVIWEMHLNELSVYFCSIQNAPVNAVCENIRNYNDN